LPIHFADAKVVPCYADEKPAAPPDAVCEPRVLNPWACPSRRERRSLAVTRQTLNNVIHGKSGISPQMAIRLSKAFGSTPETWLRMQLVYDLAQARKDESKIKVRRQHVLQELHAQ